ncbi:MAG: hypothetical protein WC789_11695 [Lentisphaeria bacterium]|jgi:hypothetical protein
MVRQAIKMIVAVGLVAAAITAPAALRADELPVAGTAEKPVLRLTLGKDAAPEIPGSVVAPGQVGEHEGDDYAAPGKAEVVSAHKGSGEWSVSFRHTLAVAPRGGDYEFWACWKQGGEPKVCAQEFTVLAGPDAGALTERGAFRLTNDSPWKFQWVRGRGTIQLQESDRMIEVRNAGRGVDAKVFGGFLLAPAAAVPAQ